MQSSARTRHAHTSARKLIPLVGLVALLLLAACAGADGKPTTVPTDASATPPSVSVPEEPADPLAEARHAPNRQAYEEAAGILEQLLADRPADASAEAYYLLGNAYVGQGGYSDAEGAFRESVALDGTHVNALSNLGYVLYQQEDFLGAEQAYRHALEQAPDDGDLHYNLGGVLAARQQLEAAEKEFQTALRLDPDLVQPYLGLGQVYYEQERGEEAAQALREFIARSDDEVWVQRAQGMLGDLAQRGLIEGTD